MGIIVNGAFSSSEQKTLLAQAYGCIAPGSSYTTIKTEQYDEKMQVVSGSTYTVRITFNIYYNQDSRNRRAAPITRIDVIKSDVADLTAVSITTLYQDLKNKIMADYGVAAQAITDV